jgi:SAM-dependent methyltransferase
VARYALTISDVELARYRSMAQRAMTEESEELKLAGVRPGATVADVGCGPAAMSVALAGLVGPHGSIIAIEPDEQSRATASAVIEASGASNIELRAGTATETGLEPTSADVVMLRHVLAHNGGCEQDSVNHLATRARHGGTVYLVDVDLTAIRVVGADPALDDLQEKYVAFHEGRGDDPRVGLRLAQLLRSAGLELLTFVGRYSIIDVPAGMRAPAWAARGAMLASGSATQEDIDRWTEAFKRTDAAQVRPTVFAPVFIAIGKRP